MTPTGAMLFAAGLGLRMRPLTLDRPKCLVPVAGKPLIDHALDVATGAGANPIVVNTHHHAGQIADHLEGWRVIVANEPREPLETGGGLKAASMCFGDEDAPVFTLNTDAVWTGENALLQLRRNWHDRAEALLLLVPDSGGGDFSMASDGRIQRGLGYRYTGAQIIVRTRIQRRKASVFSLNEIWDEMIADSTAYGLVTTGGWCDVGTPDAVEKAEFLLASSNG